MKPRTRAAKRAAARAAAAELSDIITSSTFALARLKQGMADLAALERAEAREARRRVQLPACGALTRAGHPCRRKVVPTRDRCRLHGGFSTGPQTAEGRARLREAMRARWARWRAGDGARPGARPTEGLSLVSVEKTRSGGRASSEKIAQVRGSSAPWWRSVSWCFAAFRNRLNGNGA